MGSMQTCLSLGFMEKNLHRILSLGLEKGIFMSGDIIIINETSSP
jgi:hypothetical protein